MCTVMHNDVIYNSYFAGPQQPSILYTDTGGIYRHIPANQLIYGGSNHTPYPHLSPAISTTASNSPLTHLPSHSGPFQYLPQSTTQHSTLSQQRHPTYGPAVLPSSLQSPGLARTTSYLSSQQQQRTQTMNYNVGYTTNTLSTTSSSSFTSQHMHQPPMPVPETTERVPGQQTAFPTPPESSSFIPTPLTVQQQQQQQQSSQPQPQTQRQQWSAPSFQ